MMSKKLTQAVFEGLPPEYRWVAVDADGRAYAQNSGNIQRLDTGWSVPKSLIFLGEGYDASGWQNSLIEREVWVMVDEKGGWDLYQQKQQNELVNELSRMNERVRQMIDNQAAEIATLKAIKPVEDMNLEQFAEKMISGGFDIEIDALEKYGIQISNYYHSLEMAEAQAERAIGGYTLKTVALFRELKAHLVSGKV